MTSAPPPRPVTDALLMLLVRGTVTIALLVDRGALVAWQEGGR